MASLHPHAERSCPYLVKGYGREGRTVTGYY